MIEAIQRLTVKTATSEIQLEPGHPVEFPEEQGRKLLAKAAGKVRVVTPEPPRPDWLGAWRTLAKLTDGIERDDHRFPAIMHALTGCDEAFARGDYTAFQAAALWVRQAVSSPQSGIDSGGA